MKVNYIHKFNQSTEDEFLKIQNKLKEKIQVDQNIRLDAVKKCAGVDIAYWEEMGKTIGGCSIVIVDFDTKEVLEKVENIREIQIPYIPGFLAFRELPLVLETVEKITVEPDIFIFDGNGILHNNRMGIATHASFFLNKPTFGVAKSYFKVGDVDFIVPENILGNYTNIIIDGEISGRALRSREDAKPTFISCGNYINIESCYKITMNLLSKDSRVPIPTRLADIETHRIRKENS